MLTNCPTFLSKCSPVPGFGDHDTAALVDMFVTLSVTSLSNVNFHVGTELTSQHFVMRLTKDVITSVELPLKKRQSTNSGMKLKQLLNTQERHVPIVTTSKRFNQPWFNQMCKRAAR